MNKNSIYFWSIFYKNSQEVWLVFYETELRFLCDTLQKCHIQANIISLSTPLEQRLETMSLPSQFGQLHSARDFLASLPDPQPAVLYRLTDPFFCHYLYCCLPNLARDTMLVIGPYLTREPTNQQIMEWAEMNGISPARQKYLYTFYCGVPMLHETNYLYAILETFGERLWGTSGFTMEDVHQDPFVSSAPIKEKDASDEEDTLWNMKNMEQRYAYENELMDAVSKGQVHKADMLLSTFSHMTFEQRATDPLRNLKNYCIIMNTLLRKAAEHGGVHPLYLDSTSSDFALKIEHLTTTDDIHPLMMEMFRSYCRLVRTHSMKDYSPAIQKAITCIDADLAGSLNLRTLAHMLNVSSSYLSTLFKKETGQTLTEYINRRRVKHAMHLLKTTRLQVQTIAQHCGILDVHYFSKIFKKVTGMTPKAYRQSLNG